MFARYVQDNIKTRGRDRKFCKDVEIEYKEILRKECRNGH